MTMDYFDEINSHKYLYLVNIAEPEDNSLFLEVKEAHPSGIPEDIQIFGVTLKNTQEVLSNQDSPLYEILFRNYIAYFVTNESYGIPHENEVFSGSLFRIYTRSKFLEFILNSTFATKEYPGPLKHFSILCENHIIDVATVDEPGIKKTRGSEVK